MARLELRYNEHVATSGDVVALIKKADTNHDMDLDVAEIRRLLEVCIVLQFCFDCSGESATPNSND